MFSISRHSYAARRLLLLGALLILLAACGLEPAGPAIATATPAQSTIPTVAGVFGSQATPSPPQAGPGQEATDTPAAELPAAGLEDALVIDVSAPGQPADPRLLGANLPAWLNPTRLSDATFVNRLKATGATLVRMPGGSWSNGYDWLACERDGQGIDDQATCWWTWAARPRDFAAFMVDTGMQGMWTINQNGTSQEAAALVAYFNGSVDDTRTIGVDVRGRDWGTVGQWAQLRADHGQTQPVPIRYWEIGNETYGGKRDMGGADCIDWGWEDVWTCNGGEYALGKDSGSQRKEGLVEFRQAMQAVDPSIQVGAVGVSDPSSWGEWGNEVLAAAGEQLDFYVVHEYAFWDKPGDIRQALSFPYGPWEDNMQRMQAAFDRYAPGRDIPVAVTEYNLFSTYDRDTEDWMSRAVNGLFLADTLGQMATHGYRLGAQWAFANGGETSNYGLLHADSYARSPQYYAFPLWQRFGLADGVDLLPLQNPFDPVDTLSAYAGRTPDGTITLLAINKTGEPQQAQIALSGAGGILGGTADVAQADALTDMQMTFNGLSDPADDLSDAPPAALPAGDGPLTYTFPPYSITTLRLQPDTGASEPPPDLPERVYLPLIGQW